MKLTAHTERIRGSRSKDLVRHQELEPFVFDPVANLPSEEMNWIKQTTGSEEHKQVSRTLATAWMRWVDPNHLDWMYGKAMGRPALLDQFTQKVGSTDENERVIALLKLAEVIEVYPFERQLRPEFPQLKRLFLPGQEGFLGLHARELVSFLKIWPEKKQAILEQVVGSIPDVVPQLISALATLPTDHFLETAANLVLALPEIRPQIESMLAERTADIKTQLLGSSHRAKQPSPRAPFDPFIAYQKLLRYLTILGAGESVIDDKGEIRLKSKPPALQLKRPLPERSQG